ncbi:DUF6287 domain-containing protein [Streptococcus dentapri]|uniref:DUF6287 domain-containing protein n=1 Tax=Streptococcus dentapri TaxID=573564 RepID=A0ABV8D021_9STRE
MKKKIAIILSVSLVILLSLGSWGCSRNQSQPSNKSAESTQLASRSTSKASTKNSDSQSSSTTDTSNSDDSTQNSSAESSFDYDALENGDFSTITGIWADANGRTMIISPEGQINVLGTAGTIEVSRDGKGEALMTITYTDATSLGMLMYSAGEKIPDRHFKSGDTDPSDTNKNRIVSPSSDIFDEEGTQQFLNQVFYKTSENDRI